MSVTSVVEGFTRMFLHWRNATREKWNLGMLGDYLEA